MGSDAGSSVPYNGGSLIGVSIAIGFLQILLVAARFYTRYLRRLSCGLDDYLIIPALLAAASFVYRPYVSLVCIAQKGRDWQSCKVDKIAGFGNHLEYVEQTPWKLGLYANQILDFLFAVTPAKISILLFYVRIFSVRKFQIFAYATIPGDPCFVQEDFYRHVSLPNIVTDLLMLIMPLPFVWNLRTHLWQKMALTGVFLLGSRDILRMTTFFKNSAITDPTWNSAELGIWTILECGIIIIAACLPPIWPLIARIVPRSPLTSSSSKSQPRHRYSNSQPKVKSVDGFARLGDSVETDIESRRKPSQHGLESPESPLESTETIQMKNMGEIGQAY
ncbi:hypothetical protein ASPWEDRAFT_175179 [Aspergillus wentii DTO 134E9]|uniref:Rhodopsin domain-containing protein n=1 Tax=Aspergillus wentii DTO 134E9 TaxID=1073089 RepID=A0A1L9RAA9_ASPWE|nr:uncharacterized protein ASPWEDRAFT_175179 [Aspergillus wentii DTO 134E9]OJJ31864.1 hypothetical protein ASPWEDRAFT_175179 [Aspergillus wentii DTO 134E9]